MKKEYQRNKLPYTHAIAVIDGGVSGFMTITS
jgi:hypothetical protein